MDPLAKLKKLQARMRTKAEMASTDYEAALRMAAREEQFSYAAIAELLRSVECIGASGGPSRALLDALADGVTT